MSTPNLLVDVRDFANEIGYEGVSKVIRVQGNVKGNGSGSFVILLNREYSVGVQHFQDKKGNHQKEGSYHCPCEIEVTNNYHSDKNIER